MNVDKAYEADILRSFEKGEWESVENLKIEMDRYRRSASKTLLNNRPIKVSISTLYTQRTRKHIPHV